MSTIIGGYFRVHALPPREAHIYFEAHNYFKDAFTDEAELSNQHHSVFVLSHRIAVFQSFRWRSETRHQRFNFRRDLRFVNEQKRSIVEKELASESLSARTEFQFVCSNSPQIERQAHYFSGSSIRFFEAAGAAFGSLPRLGRLR